RGHFRLPGHRVDAEAEQHPDAGPWADRGETVSDQLEALVEVGDVARRGRRRERVEHPAPPFLASLDRSSFPTVLWRPQLRPASRDDDLKGNERLSSPAELQQGVGAVG